MTHISRPFQVALAVVALFGAVWVFALNRHSSPSSESSAPVASTPTATPTATPSSTAAKASAPSGGAGGSEASSKVYHGSAPGVTGLTRAVAKAHGAVTTSEQNAKQLDQRSGQASSAATPTAASSTPTPAATTPAAATPASTTTASTTTASTAPAATTSAPAQSASKATGAPGKAGPTQAPSRQRSVEAALQRGRVAVLLFWNPKGFDDGLVHREVQFLASHKGVAVYQAPASQVASFGSITRGVQVYGTPTLLIVVKGGKTRVITGLTDVYAIEQAIDETRHA